MKINLLASAVLVGTMLTGPAFADLSVQDILNEADQKRGALHGATWSLAVSEKAGQTKLFVKARDENWIAEYAAPASEQGKKILERGLNMWFIAPDSSRPTPISPRQKLLGAASYGDIAGQRWSSDYTVVGSDQHYENGVQMYRIDLKAANDNATYDAITLYIEGEDLTAVRSEMKNSNGDIIKTATYEYKNKVPSRYANKAGQYDDAKFISKMTIAANGTETVLTYSDVKLTVLSPQEFQLNTVLSF